MVAALLVDVNAIGSRWWLDAKRNSVVARRLEDNLCKPVRVRMEQWQRPCFSNCVVTKCQ